MAPTSLPELSRAPRMWGSAEPAGTPLGFWLKKTQKAVANSCGHVEAACAGGDIKPMWQAAEEQGSTAARTHHSSLVALHELHDLAGRFLPQEDVAAVAAAHHKLAFRAIKIDAFH